jgi:hypothetical protein
MSLEDVRGREQAIVVMELQQASLYSSPQNVHSEPSSIGESLVPTLVSNTDSGTHYLYYGELTLTYSS